MAKNRIDDFDRQDSPEIRFQRERIKQLLFELRNACSLTEGGPQTYEDLEQMTGRAHSTIGSWYEGTPMQQVEFILSLLERLPVSRRHQLLDRVCRIHPTLLHPHIAHDPLAQLRLEKIMRQPCGLTIIRGQEYEQGFVLAAIGNSVRHLRRGSVSVHGLDTQIRPWPPLRNVISTQECRDTGSFRDRIAELKQAQDGGVILLGGDWWKLNGLGDEIGQLANRCNVFATEAPIFRPPIKLQPRPRTVQWLNVKRVSESPAWLQVLFSTG